MPGTLYIVATPIGNLEDLTPRAARILGEVALVAAEDTRSARLLLSHLGVRTPTIRYDEHSAMRQTPRVLRALEGSDAAFVSDAGVPGVSDPGAALVRAVTDAGHRVVPLPGPSAVTTALSVAGLPADAFRFIGFLPRTSKARQRAFAGLATGETVVFFETPHRFRAAIADLREVLGDAHVVVCRELTKLHEEVWRGTADEALAHFAEPRGEFTVVLEGPRKAKAAPDEALVRQQLAALKDRGVSRRDAAAEVAAQAGVSRRVAYRLWPEP